MNTTSSKSDKVRFSVKGQIVIPRWLRTEFGIEEGTHALVYPENGHIVIQPITPGYIRSLRGKYKHLGLMETLKKMKQEERDL